MRSRPCASETEISRLAGEWLKRANDTGELAPRTVEGYAYCLDSLARAGIAERADLTRERVSRWLEEERAAGVQASTCNRHLAAVCSFASELEKRGLFALDGLLGLRRLRFRLPPAPPPRFLSREKAGELEAAAARVDRSEGRAPGEPGLLLAVVLGIACGGRAGEFAQLRREELRLGEEHPFLTIKRDEVRRSKTYSERSVPISQADAAKLRSLGADRGEGPVFPAERPEARGEYLRANTLGRRLALARPVLGEHVDFYDLRHTFASWHVQAGVSIAKVARWLGNTVAVCERHYAALSPGGDPDASKRDAA